MNCFPCFSSKKEDEEQQQEAATDAPATADNNAEAQPSFTPPPPQQVSSTDNRPSSSDEDDNDEPFDADEDVNSAKAFTFRELASAAKNFRQECLIGEGGYGRVFRGTLQCSGQIVALRKLDRSGTKESKEFEVDVLMLSLLNHQNLVRLIGYCAEGDQRLLVYEYMPTGPLTKHLFDIPADKKPLNWSARMRIASGIAQGLEYLHEKANPPIIYCDLKSSNILLDSTNNPRLSEYGLAKLVQQNGNKMHLAPKTAASGYCAPEYERNGDLTFKSDVYSFGVVLLELISGRRALDSTRPAEEENIVTWAQPIFRDPRRFPDLADPLLKGEFSVTSLNQVVGVAAMCLQEEPMVRPMVSDVVAALSFLAMAPPNAPIPARLAPILSTRVETLSQPANVPSLKNGSVSTHKKNESSDSESEDESDQELQPNDDNKEDGSNDDNNGDGSQDDNNEDGSDDDNNEERPNDDNHEDGHSQHSDHDCADSSESDTENKKAVMDPDLNKSSKRFKESAKWSSSSKRRSKSKSEGTRSVTSSSGNGSSFGSSDSSDGFSLRCDSAYPDRNLHSDSRQDYNSGSGSSSEEESVHESRSGHGSRNRRLKSMKSRNSSNKDLHNTSLSSNKSSSSKRQYSSGKSSGSHSRKYDDNVEVESDEDDDESDFVYSRHSSSAGSDYGEHSSPKQDEDEIQVETGA